MFTGITSLNGNPDLYLENAKGKLQGVVIMGFDKDGDEYFKSSYAGGPDVLWLMERFKKMLLEVPDRETEGDESP